MSYFFSLKEARDNFEKSAPLQDTDEPFFLAFQSMQIYKRPSEWPQMRWWTISPEFDHKKNKLSAVKNIRKPVTS